MRSTRHYGDNSSGGQSIPDDLGGIHPAPSSSVLLLHPFQGLQQPPRSTHQCPLHAFMGLPSSHCHWATGKFYKHFTSPLPCCQIFPPPATPSSPHQTISVNGVNSPSQKPVHHSTLPLTGHIQLTPKLIDVISSVSPELSHVFLPPLTCLYFRKSIRIPPRPHQ